MQRLRMTLRSLAQHRLRTALAMLGVFLGALALTCVLHITRAMSAKADLEVQRLGPNLIQVLSGQTRFRRSALADTVRVTGGVTTLTLDDARAVLDQVPQIRDGVPFCQRNRPVRFGSLATRASMIGAPPAYARVRLLEVAHGRYFNET